MAGIVIPSVSGSYSSYGFNDDTGYDFIVANGVYIGKSRFSDNYPIFDIYMLAFNSFNDARAFYVRTNSGVHVLVYSLMDRNVIATRLYGANKSPLRVPSTPRSTIIDGNEYTIYGYNDDNFTIIDGSVPEGQTIHNSYDEAAKVFLGLSGLYPITYSYNNSTVSGPSESAIGDTVIVSAVPDVDYGITDASSQIIVTNNDVAVPYTWDAANQRITFTMPDPT